MTKTRRNSWRGARKAHGVASHLGWAYRRDRKHGPRSVARYLSAAGISRSGLRKYRKSRKTPARYLAKKRHHRAKRYGGVLANRGRRVGRYASFVRSFSHRHRGLKGPALMRAAGRAWRHGARRNVTIGPIATMNRPRRKRRGYRRNPVLPYAAFNKPRRRHHKKRRGHRRNPVLPYAAFNRGRRRRSRRNPVLPYAAFNPKSGSGVTGGLKASFQEAISVDYWTNTVIPIGAGFMLSQFAGGLLYGVVSGAMGVQHGIGGSIQRIGCRALGAVATSAAAMFLPQSGGKGKKGGGRGMATKVLAGGLVATLVTIVQEAFGMATYNTITGSAMADFNGMAADLTEELKAKIANSVRNEIAKAEAVAPGGVSAFVSTQNLQTAPDFGGGPRIGNMGSFVSQEGLHTAPNFAAQAHHAHHMHHQGPPVVADLSAFSDSFADMMLV